MAALTVFLLIAAGVVVCSYRDPAARFRPFVSLSASAIAGACFAAAAWRVTTAAPASLAELIASVLVFAAAVWSRGNVARLIPQFPPQNWRSEP